MWTRDVYDEMTDVNGCLVRTCNFVSTQHSHIIHREARLKWKAATVEALNRIHRLTVIVKYASGGTATEGLPHDAYRCCLLPCYLNFSNQTCGGPGTAIGALAVASCHDGPAEQ